MDIKESLCTKDLKQENLKKLVRNIFLWLRRKEIIPNLKSEQLFMGMDINDFEEEILCLILEKRDYICSRDIVSFSLLCTIVKNYFVDKYLRKPETFKKFISIHEPITDDDEVTLEDTISDATDSPEAFNEYIYIFEILEILKKSLSDREKETLCYMIYKELNSKKNPFLMELSSDAKYQSVSRLRKKIKKLLGNESIKEILENISPERARTFIKLTMSEICKNLVKK